MQTAGVVIRNVPGCKNRGHRRCPGPQPPSQILRRHRNQIHLVTPARETVGVRAQWLALMKELSEDTLDEVRNFAEFLKQKRTQPAQAS